MQKEYILETKKFSYQQVIQIYVVVVHVVVCSLVVVLLVVIYIVVLSKCPLSPFRLCQKKYEQDTYPLSLRNLFNLQILCLYTKNLTCCVPASDNLAVFDFRKINRICHVFTSFYLSHRIKLAFAHHYTTMIFLLYHS